MLSWKKLLNPQRRKTKAGSSESMNTGGGREELERDYDRILFATPTRRLADKTQVFPLGNNDHVRTRLTHSHEVSNLARSVGVRLAFEYPEKVFGSDHDELRVKRNIPALLAAIGLAHDLGNPPFGHQGEKAMRLWFEEKNQAPESDLYEKVHPDFLSFDGNAQTLRLLMRLQILNDDFGLNLTYATLSALIKYPCFYDSTASGFRKFGIFDSERKIVEEVWDEVGLEQGVRHPLTLIMEACDDIAYSVMDAEDTVKMSYASFYDLIDFLRYRGDSDPLVEELIRKAEKKNKDFKELDLSSSELNEISMQMFRVKAISQMIEAVTDTFVESVEIVMKRDVDAAFELVTNSKARKLCEILKAFDNRHGFVNRQVLELELQGNNYLMSTMDMLWQGITYRDQGGPFEKYAYGRISENYRRVYENSKLSNDLRARKHLLCDAISGMTDSYIIEFHNELRPLANGFRS